MNEFEWRCADCNLDITNLQLQFKSSRHSAENEGTGSLSEDDTIYGNIDHHDEADSVETDNL